MTGSRLRLNDLLFALVFSLLISHELDAMIRAEWRLLPGFGRFDDSTAADVFNLVHVPLFAVLIWLVTSERSTTKHRTMVGVELFVIGHAVAHALLSGDERYEFEAPVETITVYGAALLAAIELALRARAQRRPRV